MPKKLNELKAEFDVSTRHFKVGAVGNLAVIIAGVIAIVFLIALGLVLWFSTRNGPYH